MKKIYTYILTISLCMLSGCTWHKCIIPPHPIPSQFTYQYTACDQKIMTDWWEQFNDATLNNLIKQSIEYNYNLRIAIEKIEEARAFYQIKTAELFPQIGIAGDVQRIRVSSRIQELADAEQPLSSDQIIGIPGKTTSFFSLGFDTVWEVDFWGKIWHEKRARYYSFQAQIEQMRLIYIILLADVAHAYVSLCALNAQVHLTQAMVDIDGELVTLQQDLYTAGLASAIDVATQQQIADTDANQLKALQTALMQTKNQLALLTGQNPESFIVGTISAHVPLSHTPLTIGLPSDLLKQRPDIRQAERLLASASESVARAVAEWFPSFSLLGGASSQVSTGMNLFSCGSLSWNIGPSVRWPIINFGRIKAIVKTQESVERQAALSYSQTIITALKEVEDFLIAYFQNQEQIIILTQKQNAAQASEILLQDKYTSGLSNKLEALNFTKNRIATDIELISIQESLSNTLISLYKALGGGW